MYYYIFNIKMIVLIKVYIIWQLCHVQYKRSLQYRKCVADFTLGSCQTEPEYSNQTSRYTLTTFEIKPIQVGSLILQVWLLNTFAQILIYTLFYHELSKRARTQHPASNNQVLHTPLESTKYKRRPDACFYSLPADLSKGMLYSIHVFVIRIPTHTSVRWLQVF